LHDMRRHTKVYLTVALYRAFSSTSQTDWPVQASP
jgi:hypothetical protein